jgi:hypothetical protein
MTRTELQETSIRYAGLTSGPVAWALNTQLGQILPYVECGSRLPLLAAISFLLALLSLAAACLSWLGNTEPVRRPSSSRAHTDEFAAHTDEFAKTLSALTGALFAFALALQGASSLVLTGCER